VPSKKTGLEALSERQKEILVLISQGYQQKEIAGLLGIEPSTIRGHTEEIRQKLNVSSTRSAARLYVSWDGFVPPRQNDGGEQNRVAESTSAGSQSGHEHTDFTDYDRANPDHSQERSRGGNPDLNGTGETRKYIQHAGDSFQGEGRGGRSSSDNFTDVRNDRVSRYLALRGWLRKLNLIQWAGLTLLTTLFIIIVTGGAIVVLLGIFQAITQMSGQTR
jgi:DNA-binding CsgD family transcriptional regulator